MFEAGHSVCSKQDIPCVRGRTFLVFDAGHSLCCKHEKCIYHFLVNSADRPRIWANHQQDSRKSWDDRPNSPKSGAWIFLVFFPKPSPKRLRRNVRTKISATRNFQAGVFDRGQAICHVRKLSSNDHAFHGCLYRVLHQWLQ